MSVSKTNTGTFEEFSYVGWVSHAQIGHGSTLNAIKGKQHRAQKLSTKVSDTSTNSNGDTYSAID
jgi:hypothetical protein